MAPCAVTLLALLAWALSPPSSAVKIGKALRFNSSWSSGVNWSMGRAPAPDEVAVVDGAGGAMVELPARVLVRALVLAPEGALVMQRNGGLAALGPEPRSNAPENHFLRGGVLDWLDPDSWEPLDQGLRRAWQAVPHAQRVPCSYDTVNLPSTSFALRLPPLPLSVGGVTPYSYMFRAFLDAQRTSNPRLLKPDGLFLTPPVGAGETVGGVEFVGYCSKRTGCPCTAPAPLAAAVERRVCAHERPRCARAPPPLCEAPVQPRGHCCPVCGAFLELRVDLQRFRLEALRGAVRRALEASGAAAQGVLAYAHVLLDDRVQVVLAEGGAFRGASVDAAFALRATLLAADELAVEAASLTASGPPLAAHRWMRVAAPVLGTLAVAAAAFAAIFLVFSGWRTLISCSAEEEGSFVFARFENVEADSEAVEVVASPLATSQSFDNPLYKEKDNQMSANKMQYTTLQDEESTSEVAETSGFKRFDD